MNCPICKSEINENAKFCSKCGNPIPRCPTCGTVITRRMKFCMKDGTPLPGKMIALLPESAEKPTEVRRFCVRCGKPCDPSERICKACAGQVNANASVNATASGKSTGRKNRKSWKWTWIVLALLVFLGGIAATGYYAIEHDLIDIPVLIEMFSDESNKTEDIEEETGTPDRQEEERAEESVAEVTEEATTEPVVEETAVATEAVPLELQYISISEFEITDVHGKIWRRSEQTAEGTYHTPANAPACWSDWSIPGYSAGAVKDNKGNEYDFGIHVDGDESDYYYFEIQLDGLAAEFSGACACSDKNSAISKYVYNTSTKYTKYFEVYGDGQLLYTSPVMRYDYAPRYFAIDVTDVQVLRIQYPATPGPNEIATLYDGMLTVLADGM